MTPLEFKKRRRQLQEVILRALCFHKVWLTLQYRDEGAVGWSLDEQTRMLQQFPGFFTNVVIALQESALLNFAKVFDPDDRTASLVVLLKAARADPDLTPGCTAERLREFDGKLKTANNTLRSLQAMRNQRLAHTDANALPPTPILKRDLDLLATSIEEIYNGLSTGHDGNVYAWDRMMEHAQRDTLQVMTAVMSQRVHQ